MRLYPVVVAVLLVTTQAHADAGATLRVNLRNASGKIVGFAVFYEIIDAPNTNVVIDVTGLPPGQHVVSLREGPTCDPPEFKSVGALLNPGHTLHSYRNTMPITVSTNGKGHAALDSDLLITMVMGHTIVIDAQNADDPTQKSGRIIACGSIPNLRH